MWFLAYLYLIILQVMSLKAMAEMLCVSNQPLEGSFTGQIRKLDIRCVFRILIFLMLQNTCVHTETPAVACLFREAEIDKTEMYHCFRPGDIVRAEVRVIIIMYVTLARLPLRFASFCYSIVTGFGAGNFSRGLEVVLSFNSKKSSRSGGREK